MQNLDNPQTTIARRQQLANKRYLHLVYLAFYNRLLQKSINLPQGKKLEIGSGAGFIKKVISGVITSDIMMLPFCDMTMSAEKLSFESNSLAAIYMLNTFHHIKKPKKALSEFFRCLKRNGRVIMIEPASTPFARLVYKHLHHEDFDEKGSWQVKGQGNLSASNQALAYIIFKRDEARFSKLFPGFTITSFENHTPLNYLISGGFSKPSLLPESAFKPIDFLEKMISPLNNIFGLFTTIVLTKS